MKIIMNSCIGVFEPNMISHWVNHWRDVGVTDWRVVVHAPSADDVRFEVIMKELRDNGIEPYGWWFGDFTEVKKYDQLNLARNNIGANDWIIPADLDEFTKFPTNIINLINKCNDDNITHLCGYLVDRVSSDGELHPLQKDKSIWVQYPDEKNMTGDVMGSTRQKVLLYKHMSGSVGHGHHQPGPQVLEEHVRYLGEICYHFKWTASVIASSKNFIDKLGYWEDCYKRILTHYKKDDADG